MFCYKCGSELPAGAKCCPKCDSPAKKRQRVTIRMILGLAIFIIGAICGILFDRAILSKQLPSMLDNKQQKTENKEIQIVYTDKADKEKTVDINKSQTTNNTVNSEKETVQTKKNVKDDIHGETKTIQKSQTDNIDSKILYDEANVINDETEIATLSDKAEDNKSINAEEDPEFAKLSEAKTEDNSNINQNTEKIDTNSQKEFDVNYNKEISSTNTNAQDDLFGYVKEKVVYKKSIELESGNYNSYHGSLTKDGNYLLFSSDRINVNGKKLFQCFKRSLNEKDAHRLFEWQGNVWTPEYIENSDKIVFSSDSNSNEHIFIYDLASKKSNQFTFGKSKNMMPAVSPDGKKIAFVSNRNGGINHIWIMNHDGQGQTQLTFDKYEDREPRWAENGSSIVFTRIYEKLKKSHILKLKLSDNTITSIIESDKRNWMADLSPNGEMLAYTRSEGEKGSRNSIILRDMKTGDEQVLNFSGRLENMRPIWSANSMSFVYHSLVKNGRNLYMAVFEKEKN